MPKLPPPPRIAQYRSWCSSALAVTTMRRPGPRPPRGGCRSSGRSAATGGRSRRRGSVRRRRWWRRSRLASPGRRRGSHDRHRPTCNPSRRGRSAPTGRHGCPSSARGRSRGRRRRSRSRCAVTAASDGDGQALFATEVDRGDDVRHVAAACDQPRMAVDHAVVDPARGVVRGVSRSMSSPRRFALNAAMSLLAVLRPGSSASRASCSASGRGGVSTEPSATCTET